ncbi:MAG: 3'-5' exonuclease, partial [Oscillospiraceae bacterium]
TANLIKKIHDDDTFFITKKDKDDKEIRVRPSYSDFIILTRKNKPIKQYREALAALDIPAITSKTKNFLASEEIGIVISLLKAIDNPLDDENTLNVLMSPLYSFDAEEIAKLKLGVLGFKEDELTDAEVEIISQCTKKGSLLKCLKFCTQKAGERFNSGDNEKLKNAEEVEKALSDRKISREISSKAQAYLRDLECFRNFMSNNSTDNLIGKIYEDTDIFAVMSAYDDGRRRISNLRRFETIAEDFVAREYGMLNDFIRFIDKSIQDSSDIEEANTPESVENSVRIMSFHASKGLEAPICILAELEDKINNQDIKGSFLLNHDYYYSMDYVDKKDRYRFKTFSGNALRIVNEKRPIGEELRLLYVAMTRAQEKLIMIDKWNDSDLAKSVAMGFDLDFLFDESKPFHWVLGALNQDLDIKESKDGNKIFRDFSYNTLPLELKIYDDEKLGAFVNRATNAASVNKSDGKTDGQSNDKSEDNGKFSDEAIELSRLISKTYENIEETTRQAKFSVTELAHNASPSFFTLTKPAFAASGRVRGTDVGNAYHNFMEHISFDVVKNSSDFNLLDNIRSELHRVYDEEKITEEELSCIQPIKIAELFHSDLGKRMLNSPRIEREFPFYAEIEVSEIDETLLGKVGIQGRIDAFFVENNKIVVIDYKTDVDIDAEKEAYEKQVKIYAKVLPMLLGMEVSQTYLYSFSKGKDIAL